MPAKKSAAAKQDAAAKESGHEYRFVGPVTHTFPDLGSELAPGQEFRSELEIHHFYVELKHTHGSNVRWESTYQASPEVLQGPEPESTEED